MSLMLDVGIPAHVKENKQTIKVDPDDNVLTIYKKIKHSYIEQNAVYDKKFFVIFLNNEDIQNFNESEIYDGRISYCITKNCVRNLKLYDNLRKAITYYTSKRMFIFLKFLYYKSPGSLIKNFLECTAIIF